MHVNHNGMGKMNEGYIENGFIVDLSNARKTAEIIYELSKVLDIPEAQNKQVCLKLGDITLSQTELRSIKALVESMGSQIEFISTSSPETTAAATALEINISEIKNEYEAPDFATEEEKTEETPEVENVEEVEEITVSEPEVNAEVETALDKIFGDNNFDEDEKEVKEIEKVEFEVDEDDEETLKMKAEAEKLPTLYLKKTIRSGQSISSDGNLIIIGDVNPGAEIIAKGDITVWGILGGIAHAGSEGNTQSRIRALKMNAIQLRIADVFARRPDGANTPYVQKTNSFEPEEARIYKKSIIINKLVED